MFRKFVTNTLIFAIGPQLPKVASLFVLPIITKDLTSTDYGIAGVVMAYTGLLGGIKDLGFVVNMSNLFYRHPHRWQTGWRLLHGYMSFWSIPFTLIQSAILFIAVPKEAGSNSGWIILIYALPALFFDTTIMFGSRYYQLAQRPFYMAMTSAIVGSLTILFNLITISYFKMGYMGWFVSTLAGTFISFLFYFFPLYFKYEIVPIFKVRRQFITHQLKIALPMIPHNYSSYMLNTSDRLVMNVLGIEIKQIGIYNIAYTFGSYADFAGNAVGMAVAPIYTKLYSQGKEREAHLLTYALQFFFLAGSFLTCLWLREIFGILISNKELQIGYSLAIIVVMGYNYRPMYWAVGLKISYFEKTSLLWRISFFAGMVNIILNFIFIPIYGFKVAALTSFIGLLYIGFSGFFLRAYKEMNNARYFPFRWIALIIGLSVAVYLLKDISVIYKVILTVIVIILSIYGLMRFKRILNSFDI